MSGLCVPGASCVRLGRLFCWRDFERFPWANSATAMPNRQSTEAIRTRRLKKADFDVDFFFIDGAELFPSPVNARWSRNPRLYGKSVSTLSLEIFSHACLGPSRIQSMTRDHAVGRNWT